MRNTSEIVEAIYSRYHKPDYIHPDPLEIVREFEDIRNRECAALIASSLALGRVNLILSAVRFVLEKIPRPADMLPSMDLPDLRELFHSFSYRFFTGEHISRLLYAVGILYRRYGSLEGAFRHCPDDGDDSLLPALTRFCGLIHEAADGDLGILIPRPEKKSACKRMMLFLRWMVRCDEIDPGGWDMDPSLLIVPVDTHMLQIAACLGFTGRKQAGLAAAAEITGALKMCDPADPVKYDFSLTRPGIRPELSLVSVIADYDASRFDGAGNPGVSADDRSFSDNGISA